MAPSMSALALLRKAFTRPPTIGTALRNARPPNTGWSISSEIISPKLRLSGTVGNRPRGSLSESPGQAKKARRGNICTTMNQLYFAPGACSFVPHVGLEAVKAATGEDFEPRLVKLHKGEHKTPEYLALNPNGQVPVLVADGRPLTQIVAICDWIDRRYPKAGLLPVEPWARAEALSQLAWMNNTVHPTFTHVFRAGDFADNEAAQADVKRVAAGRYRGLLERIQEWSKKAAP